MNKRKNKRKIGIFDNGGLISWLNNTGSKLSGNSGSILGLNSGGLSLAGGIANTVAGVANGLMNPSGNSTGVGNVLSGVGSLASNIPGIGGLVGAGVNLLGGLVNAAFGSNINEEYVDLTKSNITNQAGYTSKASTNDQLMSDWGSHTNLAYVDQDDVGSDGWFSNKAKNLTKDLNSQIDEANLKALLSLSNTAGNIDTQNDLNLLANFKADGGGIHIKKKNRGKFTSYCGGKVTSECIARGKRSSSPTIRKRAVFAANSRKWKHDDGGSLFTQGGIWSNGVTQINEGGTHSENPYEGVQMGVDPNGIPNLVEEGEVIWNDYVFSNRLKPNKDMKKKNKYKGTTFANIAKNLQKESEERPNDPISNRGLNASMERLASLQESIRAKKADREARRYAKGGKLGTLYAGEGDRSNRLNTYSNYTGLSDDSFYTPEYMNFWRWIDKNRNSSSAKNWLNRINNEEFGTVGGNTFTMDNIVRLAHDYKRGPVHNAFLRASREFANSEENPLTPLTAKPLVPPMATPPIVESLERIPVGTIDAETGGNYPEYLRYAPIVGHGISVFSDLFSKPDYSAADRVASVRVNPVLVGFNPIGNYLSYEPFDRDFYINKLNANSAATRRALQNTSGGNRLQAQAGILAADNNYGNQLGDLARQAEEYNQQLRERVEGFNRQTNMYNSEMGLKASMANAESRNQATKMRLGQAGTVAAMRQAIRDAYNQRRSNNINVLLGELGDLGREAAQRRWLDDLAEAGVLRIDTSGNYVAPKAKGGKIRTKKRKGFTYG